ncbi:helix-turn-helix domain-containing protein [Corynebacterium sp. LK30]|nr:helix-turn-helix domain-containing protein [Corynebacterium sp. LK30]OFN08572.1 hypothetical protein HMPREF2614_06045 [Corynebacterium sp. HMSC074C11]
MMCPDVAMPYCDTITNINTCRWSKNDTEREVWAMPHYLTTDEAAEILRVTPATLRRWARQGLITPYRLPSGEARYTHELLEKIISPAPRKLAS